LADVNDADIHGPGMMTFALNTAYPRIRPDYWMGMDHVECYDRALWSEGFRKVCRMGCEDEIVNGWPVKTFPEVYVATTHKAENVEYIFKNYEGHAPFAWFHHTLGVMLHMLVWMGAKRIHFAGCDMGGSKDYYDDRVLSPENRNLNRNLYAKLSNGFLSSFVELGKQHGIECVSCTPESPINTKMPYVPLHKAIEASQRRAPQHGAAVMDCRDARNYRLLTEWEKTVAPRGIVTACDKNFERLLPWWLQNVRKWSAMPVAVVDLGLSPQMKAWVLNRGVLMHFDGPPLQPEKDCKSFGLLCGWKPFAAVRSPFEETLYMDLDCEVVGPLDQAFDYIKDRNFACATDQLFHHLSAAKHMEPGETMTQAGVFVCRHGSEVVNMWARECMKGLDEWRDNDQPILSKIVHHHKNLVTTLPARYNVLEPYQGNWKALIDKVTDKPAILHRLTSHPASRAVLREKAEEMFDVGGIWLENAQIAEQCEWVNPPICDKGVVIGVDQNQEWMLSWWLVRYSQHNNYPVMVADFGLSEHARQWCMEHKLIVSAPVRWGGYGWFKKPLGCLQSVFRKTVWLDTDVEVMADIGPLFDYTDLAATIDRGTPQQWKDALPGDATIYNTGCISYDWGESVIQKWAMIVMLMRELQPIEGRLLIPTGDQECFAMAVRKYAKDRIQQMPPEHHALRLGGDPARAIVKHWTGPDGKTEIRRQMTEMQPVNRLALLEQLPKNGVVAEIGVKLGEFSREIVQRTQPKELHLIDPWKHFEIGYEDTNNVSQAEQDRRYAAVRLVFMADNRVKFHRITSEAAVARFADGTFDWIYFDGNHAYMNMKRDLELYAPKMKKGGLICGHDYADLPECQGVKRAVDEFREKHGWELIACTTDDRWLSFVLRKQGE